MFKPATNIISGKLPTGHVRADEPYLRRARSRAFFQLLVVVDDLGAQLRLGNVRNQSSKLPEPGSCTNHMPEKFRERAGILCQRKRTRSQMMNAICR